MEEEEEIKATAEARGTRGGKGAQDARGGEREGKDAGGNGAGETLEGDPERSGGTMVMSEEARKKISEGRKRYLAGLTPEERSEIARHAVAARHAKKAGAETPGSGDGGKGGEASAGEGKRTGRKARLTAKERAAARREYQRQWVARKNEGARGESAQTGGKVSRKGAKAQRGDAGTSTMAAGGINAGMLPDTAPARIELMVRTFRALTPSERVLARQLFELIEEMG
jgi:hypothetical protein